MKKTPLFILSIFWVSYQSVFASQIDQNGSTASTTIANDSDPQIFLDPEALANKAKMLVNANQNDQAKTLVKSTIDANKYPRNLYIAKLLRLLPQDLIDDWLN